jgi:hypothetical protein
VSILQTRGHNSKVPTRPRAEVPRPDLTCESAANGDGLGYTVLYGWHYTVFYGRAFDRPRIGVPTVLVSVSRITQATRRGHLLSSQSVQHI